MRVYEKNTKENYLYRSVIGRIIFGCNEQLQFFKKEAYKL